MMLDVALTRWHMRARLTCALASQLVRDTPDGDAAAVSVAESPELFAALLATASKAFASAPVMALGDEAGAAAALMPTVAGVYGVLARQGFGDGETTRALQCCTQVQQAHTVALSSRVVITSYRE